MGSHTDYNEGCVLTLPIDRDTWILASPREDSIVNLSSINLESSCQFPVDSFQSKIDGWGQYAQGVAAILKKSGYKFCGFDGLIHGTVPIASGLSSSASIESAMATLLEAIGGFELVGVKKAQLCQQAENEWVGMNCGILDQYSSILGEQGAVLVLDCRTLTHRHAPLPAGIQPVICNTCSPRKLAGSEFGLRREQCESAAAYFAGVNAELKTLRDVPIDLFHEHKQQLSPEESKRAEFIIEEHARVLETAEALTKDDRDAIKQICNASFAGAKNLFEICVVQMEQMHEAMSNAPGVIGCRQAGAGFGGCMVALVESDNVDEFCEYVSKVYEEASGITPDVYAVQSADGANLLEI
jgi:galactokinase